MGPLLFPLHEDAPGPEDLDDPDVEDPLDADWLEELDIFGNPEVLQDYDDA